MSTGLPLDPTVLHVAALVSLAASVMVAAPRPELTSPGAIRKRIVRASDDFALAAALLLAAGGMGGVNALAEGTLGLAAGRSWLAAPSHALAVLALVLAIFGLVRGAWSCREVGTLAAVQFGAADAARTAGR